MSSRHVLGVIEACFGCHGGMFGVSPRHVLGAWCHVLMCWVSWSPVWVSPSHVLGGAALVAAKCFFKKNEKCNKLTKKYGGVYGGRWRSDAGMGQAQLQKVGQAALLGVHVQSSSHVWVPWSDVWGAME